MRGGRLGDEVTSQTQAVQSIADISWCFVLSLPTDGDEVNPFVGIEPTTFGYNFNPMVTFHGGAGRLSRGIGHVV